MIKSGYRVLIVDDSSDDRFFLRMLLQRHPQFEIIGEARDGQEAIDWLGTETNRPDLIFLDLKMPVKNGFDVLEWIQNQTVSGLTVVILSGAWLPEDVTKSMSLGAHAYFKKTSHKDDQRKMISDVEGLLRKSKDGER